MDARFYNTDKIEFERLAIDLENAFRMQGYQTQHFGNAEQLTVQLKKGGDIEALIGLQVSLSVTFRRTVGGMMVMTGEQKWVDKAAIGAVGFAIPALWPLMITAGAGALRQASLSSQILNLVDGLIRQQQPDVQTGPVPGSGPIPTQQ